jgi:hypothetical protein
MPHARGALLRSYPKRLAKIGWRIGVTARWPPAQDWDHVYPAVRRMAGMQAKRLI